jgi:hypothetical protein
VVTDEMITAHDWYKTFAALAGASDKVPTDRPMGGVDASQFLLGEATPPVATRACSWGRTGRRRRSSERRNPPWVRHPRPARRHAAQRSRVEHHLDELSLKC